jgi:hypothetical protein
VPGSVTRRLAAHPSISLSCPLASNFFTCVCV